MRVLGLSVGAVTWPLQPRREHTRVGATSPQLLRQPARDTVQFGTAPPRPPETLPRPSVGDLLPLIPQVGLMAASMITKAGIKPDSIALSDRVIANGAIYYDDMAHDAVVDAHTTASLLGGKTVADDQEKQFAFVDVQRQGSSGPWSVTGINTPFGTLVQDVANEMKTSPTADITLLRGLPGTATGGLVALRFKEADQPATVKILSTANSTWPGTYPAASYALNVGDTLTDAELGKKVVTLGRMHQEKTLATFLTGAAGSADEHAKVVRLLPQIVGDLKAADMLPKVDALAAKSDANERYEAMAELVNTSLANQRIRLRPYYDSFVPS